MQSILVDAWSIGDIEDGHESDLGLVKAFSPEKCIAVLDRDDPHAVWQTSLGVHMSIDSTEKELRQSDIHHAFTAQNCLIPIHLEQL